ncbi:MAG: hypothetical protein ACI4TQ_01395, partial [Alloprevotella sp.]
LGRYAHRLPPAAFTAPRPRRRPAPPLLPGNHTFHIHRLTTFLGVKTPLQSEKRTIFLAFKNYYIFAWVYKPVI